MPLPPRRRLTSVKPRPLRKLALDVLHEWNRGEDFAVALIDEAARDLKLAPRDTALLQTLIYGVLRNMSLLDHWAGLLTGNKILDRDTLNAVRLGLVQLLVLDMAPHAAVNETVEHAGRAGALVNAVLRRALREKEQLLAARDAAPVHIRCSHPEWLVQRWIAQFGEAGATALCEWNQQPAPLYVRVNQLRPKPAPFDFIKDEGNGFFLVEHLPTAAIESGSCYVQDPSTAIAPGLLAPTPSLSVLDMCAAPGGKSALLAQMMRNDGRIIATDSSGKRVQRMIANLERLGVNNVTSVVHDWVARPKGPIENKKFDRILIDVPCSNTGVMRRRVDVRWRLQEANVTALAETQAALLKCALQLLKPGGVVVYSTCSIEKAENQDVVQQVLDSDSRVKLVETQQSLPHRDGIDGAYATALQCA